MIRHILKNHFEIFVLLNRLYQKFMHYAHTPKAFAAYCLVAFTESFIFPLPPDLLMIPMILADKKSAFRLAFFGTLYSVLGGIIGYGIGCTLSHTLGHWIIETYGLQSAAQTFYASFAKWGFWIIVLKALTPIPFKLVTIASGMAHFSFPTFILASCLARAFRFYKLALLLWFFGPRIKPFIEKRLTLVFTVFMLLIILGIGMVCYFK